MKQIWVLLLSALASCGEGASAGTTIINTKYSPSGPNWADTLPGGWAGCVNGQQWRLQILSYNPTELAVWHVYAADCAVDYSKIRHERTAYLIAIPDSYDITIALERHIQKIEIFDPDKSTITDVTGTARHPAAGDEADPMTLEFEDEDTLKWAETSWTFTRQF